MHNTPAYHYRKNLIDKKHSYLIPRPPSWDDRNCSYGHQLYPSDKGVYFTTKHVKGNHKLRLKNVYERENPILKNR
jgi:hypothetical protein